MIQKKVEKHGVVDCSREITQRMGLPEEDRQLAQLIGLLHDIGRFEQLKRYNSFEPNTMDHASFGVQILFEEGMIRQFVQDNTWDSIIRTSIAKHSDYKLEGIEDSRELMHARIIRDADKLNNCRVKLEDPIETMLGVSAEEVGKTKISPEVMEQVYRKESILSQTRKTKMDYWISYLAYFFDINYEATFQIIREQNYVDRLINRIPYSNPETVAKMEEVRSIIHF